MGNLKDRIDEEDWEKIEGARADLHYKSMPKPLFMKDEATNVNTLSYYIISCNPEETWRKLSLIDKLEIVRFKESNDR